MNYKINVAGTPHPHDPLLKLDIIAVWDKHVADSVQALHPELRACKTINKRSSRCAPGEKIR
jgi:hypothetical protein